MSREIKFRVWNGTHMLAWGWLLDMGHPLRCLQSPIKPQWTLMQYIGLNDKDGQEIYEGDLASHPVYPELFVVRFINSGFGMCSQGVDMIESTIAPQVCGIVGNIYENPELGA